MIIANNKINIHIRTMNKEHIKKSTRNHFTKIIHGINKMYKRCVFSKIENTMHQFQNDNNRYLDYEKKLINLLNYKLKEKRN